jgi:hypothetical protein
MPDGEVLHKVLDDDGLDPARFPFLELFTALMELPARYFLENIQKVFWIVSLGLSASTGTESLSISGRSAINQDGHI